VQGVGPGSLLGGRYLVQRRVAQHSRFERWAAADQTLDREVVLLCFDADGPTAAAALDAARRAAGVEDHRLVRVLDIGRDDAVAFVVEEPLRGARSMTAVLADGGLPAEEARRVVGESAAALETARARGLHHSVLTPRSVLRLEDGTVKVRGLATEAALVGADDVAPDADSRADTLALVALAYAALTGRWPLPGSNAGLEAAPRVSGGVAAPSQIAVGVPADLDLIARTTLNEDHGPATPGQLAEQIAPWSPTPVPSSYGSGPSARAPARLPGTRTEPLARDRVTGGVTRPGTKGWRAPRARRLQRRPQRRAGSPSRGRREPRLDRRLAVLVGRAACSAWAWASEAPAPATTVTTARTDPMTGTPGTPPTPTRGRATSGASPPEPGRRPPQPWREPSERSPPARRPVGPPSPRVSAAPSGRPAGSPAPSGGGWGAWPAVRPTGPTNDQPPGPSAATPSSGRTPSSSARRSACPTPSNPPTSSSSRRCPCSPRPPRSRSIATNPGSPSSSSPCSLSSRRPSALWGLLKLSGIGTTSPSESAPVGTQTVTATPGGAAPAAPTPTPSSAAPTSNALIAIAASSQISSDAGVQAVKTTAQAYDGNPDTFWRSTKSYSTAAYGGIPNRQVGLLLDLGSSVDVHQVAFTLVGAADVSVHVGDQQSVDGAKQIGAVRGQDGASTVTVAGGGAAKGRYLILWFTTLGPDGEGHFRAQVAEVSVS